MTLKEPNHSYFEGKAREIMDQANRYAVQTKTTDFGIADDKVMMLIDREPLERNPPEPATCVWHEFEEEWLNNPASKKFFRGFPENYPTRIAVLLGRMNRVLTRNYPEYFNRRI
jgi:hypothetical protein